VRENQAGGRREAATSSKRTKEILRGNERDQHVKDQDGKRPTAFCLRKGAKKVPPSPAGSEKRGAHWERGHRDRAKADGDLY